MINAFVTGGHGFLGRYLCRQLTARGVRIHAPDHRACDITNAEAVSREMRGDWVFHLAAETSHDASRSKLMKTNVTGTLNVLESARKLQPRALVAVGSFEEYGDNPVPFREEMPARPLSAYAESKAEATRHVVAAGYTVVRLPVVYGPGQPTNSFIGGTCEAIRFGKNFATTPGEQTRDFLYVEDAVEALIAAADYPGHLLNACTGVESSLRQAIGIIGSIAGQTDFAEIGARPYRPNEQMRYVGDCAKITKLTGWHAKTSFSEGIRLTLASDAE